VFTFKVEVKFVKLMMLKTAKGPFIIYGGGGGTEEKCFSWQKFC
jgi:hypothetical protein